jgi:hypothetical protein
VRLLGCMYRLWSHTTYSACIHHTVPNSRLLACTTLCRTAADCLSGTTTAQQASSNTIRPRLAKSIQTRKHGVYTLILAGELSPYIRSHAVYVNRVVLANRSNAAHHTKSCKQQHKICSPHNIFKFMPAHTHSYTHV